MCGKLVVGCGATVVLSLSAAVSHAAITSFAARPAFNAAAGTIDANENFSGFAVDTPYRTVTVAANGFTLRQEGLDQLFRNQVDVAPLQFTDNNGTSHASNYTNFVEGPGTQTDVRIAFPVKAAAFGADFYGINGLPTGAEGVAMDVIVNNAVAATFTLADLPTQFFGVVATAGEQIDSVLLRSANLVVGTGGEGFGMDDVAVKFVPEPASFGALAALGAVVLRRRTR
jgi:hypothetical protein